MHDEWRVDPQEAIMTTRQFSYSAADAESLVEIASQSSERYRMRLLVLRHHEVLNEIQVRSVGWSLHPTCTVLVQVICHRSGCGVISAII